VFWADATCRKNYAHFGDLISFDSIYNTNEYIMICFLPFMGVSHHRSSVLSGTTMLSNENAKSYVLLFHTFLKDWVVHGVAHKLIISDEVASMKVAIEHFLITTARGGACDILPPFQNTCHSGFSTYIPFIMYVDIIYI
jgi:hypothetical protein